MFCSQNIELYGVIDLGYFALFSPTTVSNEALRGATPQAAAQVMQWVSFADSEIIPPASAWVFPTLGIMQFNKQVCSSFFVLKMAYIINWWLLALFSESDEPCCLELAFPHAAKCVL